jgi:hypothetical protein
MKLPDAYQFTEKRSMTLDTPEINIILEGDGQFGTPKHGTARQIRITDFAALINYLYTASLEPFNPENKLFRRWFSPCVLKPGAQTKSLADTDFLVPLISLDLDAKGWTLARIRDILTPIKMIIHTTASSTTDEPRWRVIPALDRCYSVPEHLSVWTWFNDQLNGEVDRKARDASRVSFLPAQYLGRNNEFHTFDGHDLSVDKILETHPVAEPLPPIPAVALNIAPSEIEIIQDWMVSKEIGQPSGGRMWRVMIRAASRFKRNGWDLTPRQLADAFLAVNHFISPGDPRTNIIHDADNAILWAWRNVETMPELYSIFQWRI